MEGCATLGALVGASDYKRDRKISKYMFPHGAFIPWAQKEFGWNHRHLERHMELARNTTRVRIWGRKPPPGARAAEILPRCLRRLRRIVE